MANYGDKGWIKLWRSEMHNPLYNLEPFTPWQAWIDLCLMADDQGTVKTSLEALKNRWLWKSRHKVRDFLGTVSGTGLGTVICTQNKGTLITINKGFSDSYKKKKTGGSGTVPGTKKGNEEVLPKEVDRASFEVSPSNKEKKYTDLQDELGDEYE